MKNVKNQRALVKHLEWLRARGLHPQQIALKRKTYKKEKSIPQIVEDNLPPTSDRVGNGFKKPENVYTGTNLIGIATMHKSNMVPVFRKEDAIAISQMRS